MTTIVLESRLLKVRQDFDSIREALVDERPYLLVTEVETYYPPDYTISEVPKTETERSVLINSRYIIEVRND